MLQQAMLFVETTSRSAQVLTSEVWHCRPQQQQLAGVAAPSLCHRSRRPVQTAAAMEMFQLADEGAFIGGTAAAMFAMVLIVRLLRYIWHT